MRHAQSDDFEHSCDFERPLSVRGQQDAAHMRHWFHAQSYHPQNALVSAAKRTVETYDLLQAENCNAFLSKALYLAPATTLLTALKKTTGPSVLMIGHNFGISDLANRLRKERSENPKFKIFPPGAIWVADLPTEDWRAHLGRRQLGQFCKPSRCTYEAVKRPASLTAVSGLKSGSGTILSDPIAGFRKTLRVRFVRQFALHP